MGHGATRTLAEEGASDRELNEELAKRLTVVMDRFDTLDAEFKAARDDQRFAQRAKHWGQLAKTVDGHLRVLSNVLHESHQLSLDIGSDGGGHSIKPWMEDLGRKFGRIDFRLDGGNIRARAGTQELGMVPMDQVTYEWCEQMVVDWLVRAVEARK